MILGNTKIIEKGQLMMKSFVGNLANKRNTHTNFSGGKWGNNRTTVKRLEEE